MTINKTTQYTTNPDTIPVNTSIGSQTIKGGLDKRIVDAASLAELLSFPTNGLVDGQQVQVKEYAQDTCRGGGLFYWDASSTEVDNGGTIIEVSGVATGRWKRIYKGIPLASYFGAIGDGSSDDTDALVRADSSGRFKVGEGVYKVSSDANLSSDIVIDDDAKLAPGSGVTLTISGLVTPSRTGEFREGSGIVNINSVTLNVPSDYSTIQDAIDAIPKVIVQQVVVEVASGTYNEAVRVDGILAGGTLLDETGRPKVTIRGANAIAKDPDVKISSITATSCTGTNSHPGISNLTITSGEPYGSNDAGISFNGCTAGEVQGVSFAGTGCTNCIMAYASRVMYSNCDFGSSVNTNAVRTKHLGTAHDQGDNSGLLTGHVYYPETGYILIDGFGNGVLKGNLGLVATSRHNFRIAGVLINNSDNSLWNATRFGAGLLSSEWHSRFESISNYIQETAGGNVTARDDQGLRLETLATSGNYAGLAVRRRAELSTSNGQSFSTGQTIEIAKYFVQKGGGRWEAVTGSLDGEYFGFRFDGTDLYGISKGSGAETVVLLESNWTDQIGAMSAVLWGDHIEFFEKSNFMGIIDSDLPTTNSTSTLFNVRLTAQQNTNNILYVGEARIRK